MTQARTQVQMIWNGGGDCPMLVQLSADGSVSPDTNHRITVYADYIIALIKGGWSLVVPEVLCGDSTHVP